MAAVAFCQEMQAEFGAAGVASIISGVIGPRRDAWQYDKRMTVEEAEAYHTPQVEAFADTDADYVTAYTLTNVPEAVGIARAAQRAGMPVALSFTLETDGNLPGGKPLELAINEVDTATGAYPAYYMINCVHPIHFASTVRNGGEWVNRIGGLRVNASMMSHAELDNSPTLDIGDLTDLAAALRAGAAAAAQHPGDRRLLRHRPPAYRGDLRHLPAGRTASPLNSNLRGRSKDDDYDDD